jgi:hypothetical protein
MPRLRPVLRHPASIRRRRVERVPELQRLTAQNVRRYWRHLQRVRVLSNRFPWQREGGTFIRFFVKRIFVKRIIVSHAFARCVFVRVTVYLVMRGHIPPQLLVIGGPGALLIILLRNTRSGIRPGRARALNATVEAQGALGCRCGVGHNPRVASQANVRWTRRSVSAHLIADNSPR